MQNLLKLCCLLLIAASACKSGDPKATFSLANPVIITEQTPNDTDDPAIWVNFNDPSSSLILGTDKGDTTGGIYVFNLQGQIIDSLSIKNIHRPNNIDIAYGFQWGDTLIDIAAFTERGRNMIRIIELPSCRFIDNGGIPVFENETQRDPMGIALYKDKNNDFFAFVSRKDGPIENYLHQYKLIANNGEVTAQKIRAFGSFSGKKEIEAIVVDSELGYVYYSDENIGVRKYYADADKGNEELALFATSKIKEDHEGISIFKQENGKGFIILSDQQANAFHIFPREGYNENPHSHPLLHIVKTKTDESDGSDITHIPLNETFKHGLFVAMSTDRTFQFYRAEDIVPIK